VSAHFSSHEFESNHRSISAMPFKPLLALPYEKRDAADIQKPGHVERAADLNPVYIQKPGHVANEKRTTAEIQKPGHDTNEKRRQPIGHDAQPTGFKGKKKKRSGGA
jgi:hypothetical protein